MKESEAKFRSAVADKKENNQVRKPIKLPTLLDQIPEVENSFNTDNTSEPATEEVTKIDKERLDVLLIFNKLQVIFHDVEWKDGAEAFETMNSKLSESRIDSSRGYSDLSS